MGVVGVLAAAVWLIAPATSLAITPAIENTGTNMFEQTITARESGNSANRLEIFVVVKHDPGVKVTGLRVDDDYDGTDESSTAAIETADVADQPTVAAGGFNYTSAFVTMRNTVSNIGCGDRPGFEHTIYVRPVVTGSITGNMSSASIFFTPAGGCNIYEDYPYMYGQSNTSPIDLVAGGTNAQRQASFSFTADDPDSGNNTQGYAFRYRRLNDGLTVNEAGTEDALTQVCPGDIDNEEQTRTYTFPNRRGHWVVEARLREGDSCANSGTGTLDDEFWRIGSASINHTTAPTLSLSATRPPTNGSTTITATTADGSDSSNGGAPQYIEWDLDNNSAYEDATLGTATVSGAGDDSLQLSASEKATTLNTTGKAPGSYTVRARVTDNGGINAADGDRKQTVATTTYTVNSPPTANAQTLSTTTGAALPITLSGADANSDPLTYNIGTGPSNGSLSGSGAARTYTPNPGFAGTDSLTFTTSDNYNGTSSAATVTINVRPETTIDDGPANASTVAPGDVEFEFSSNATGATFQCQIDGGGYSSCTSPQAYPGLNDGSHTFDVRAVAASQTDQSPATRTFAVDGTPPNTTIDSGPANGSTTNDDSVTFEFSSSEPSSTFECQVDGTGFGSCTSPATYSNLGPGSHTFEVRATDQYNNTDQTPASRTFTLIDAGFVTGDGSTTTFTAESGDTNNVVVTGGGGLPYVITDTGGGNVDAGPGCTQVTANSVTCPDTANIVINLGDGNDTFNGATAAGGNFTINGGPGNDNLTGTNGGDTINGGSDAGMDRMEGGQGADTINGGGGIDRALYTNSVNPLDITIDGNANDTDGTGATTENVGTDVESITGGNGDDVITGSCLANTLAGQGGNDTLNGDPNGCGVGGGDFMGGGLGNDAMNGLDGSDSVTYTTNSAAQAISVSLDGAGNDNDGTLGTDNIASDVEYVYGGAGDDTIDASAALLGVSLWGRAGNDTLIGSPNNDYLRGEAGADNLNCAGGPNDMYDNDPADTVDPSCETAG